VSSIICVFQPLSGERSYAVSGGRGGHVYIVSCVSGVSTILDAESYGQEQSSSTPEEENRQEEELHVT
jgi:hypothetical protein